MSKWTLARYAKMCRDCRSDAESEYKDMLDSSELWYDMAQCMLDNDDDGLEAFIRDEIGASDFKGCLADDLAYPGNCRSYVLKKKKKSK